MCGFFGIFGAPSRGILEERDRVLESCLAHRGPDDFQLLKDERFKVMFWRLSIVDELGGKQPMVSPDGKLVILFNGEIYNYKSLKSELEQLGSVFRNHSDTEVVLEAYRRWGTAAFVRFEGMFAITIIDTVARKVVLVRDRLGVKPLYFRSHPGQLTIASEQKAILESLDGAPELDRMSFRSYLVFQAVPGSRTMFRGISKVRPGSVFLFDLDTQEFLGAERIRSEEPTRKPSSYDEFKEMARETILEQSRLAYETHLPAAFHLSGGLDSNTLIGLCRQLDPERKILCISSLIEGEEDPEWDLIREAAGFYEAQLRVVSITAEKFFETLDEVIFHLDEPVGDPGVVAQFLVNQLAGSDCKIVYSGQGFDEMFFGYIRNLATYVLATGGTGALDPETEEHRGLPAGTREFFGGWEGFLKTMAENPRIQPEFAYFKKLCRFNPFDSLPEFDPNILADLRSLAFEAYQTLKAKTRSLHEFMVLTETAIQLPSLLHMEDRASMRYSLETRVPFCTASVLDLALRSRPEWTFQGGMPKGILRDLFGHLLPPCILARKQKVGRPIPLRNWLNGKTGHSVLEQLKGREELFRDLMGREYFDYAFRHPSPYDRSVWTLLSLSRWIDLYGVRT